MKDDEIVSLFVKRDERAIAECEWKYGSKLQMIAKNVIDDVETAMECENDTYLQAWNSIPPKDPSEYLFPFLARIIRHKALDACRKRNASKRSAVITELTSELEQCIPGEETVENKIFESDLSSIINEFLGTLKAENRIVFMRRYWYMDSVKDISKNVGCSESKVKSILFRTRNQMREYLMKEGIQL